MTAAADCNDQSISWLSTDVRQLIQNSHVVRYTHFMLNREACERRVYRLATLLTGNPNAATKVISQVLDAQPDLRNLDSAHLDRLTVLRSREINPAVLVSDAVPSPVAATLAQLNAQQREAWVFADVYRMHEREMAKAMDCSVTATQRHLEQAKLAIEKSLREEAASAAQALLAYSMSLDVPRFYRAERKRRRQARIALMLTVAAVLALAIAGLLIWWTRPLTG